MRSTPDRLAWPRAPAAWHPGPLGVNGEKGIGCTLQVVVDGATAAGRTRRSHAVPLAKDTGPIAECMRTLTPGESLMAKSTTFELSQSELQILVQSLSNCIDTCKDHGHSGTASCPDCDAAKALRKRLQQSKTA